MANSPIQEGNTILSYTIESDGSPIPDTYGVTSISISQEINVIATAQITLRDGNAADQMFKITDAGTFEPGVKIEISLGYNGNNEKVFSGIVVTQSIQIGDSGTTLQISCKDSVVKATKSKSKLVLENKKDSDAMEQIASTLKLSKSIAETEVEHESIVQYNATDWDFIVNRAELNGMVVVTDKGTLTVAKPPVDATPEIGLKYGRDILEMDTKLETTDQYESVSGSYWDVDQQEQVSVSASEPSLNKQGDLSVSELDDVLSASNELNAAVPLTQEETQSWADAAMLKYRLSRFQGNISFQGSSSIKANSMISLEGLGTRFNGNAYVSAVSHSLSDGQWKTEVTIGLSKEWFSEKVASSSGSVASGALKGVKGLQVGKVQSIYDEDEKEFRVQVQIPVINNKTEMLWARLSTFYASENFGAFFYPEEGDEVIVGFIDGDPRFPIILGSVYSSALPPPVPIEDANNNIKMLMTKSQLQFQFDDENVVMTLVTPNKNTLVISDADKGVTITDENENQIQLNDSGITIESKSSMTIKAADDLTIQASSITVKADNSVDISGGTIDASANQSVSISGNTECTVSSSGQTNVKGTMVNLN
ncbi:type VI secretion system tip protein VgrG [Spongiimicrobium salis]|uniref:type VI secretion system tip protein VgrG n=1 Tax=Spongiimicrobium salis TaxID=1667022 RepID=UPI00374DA793